MKYFEGRKLPKSFRQVLRVTAVVAALGAVMGAILWPAHEAIAAQVTIDGAANNAVSTWKPNSSPDTVFISDQVGYTFYRGGSSGTPLTSGRCVYSKTTDGGSTWGTPVLVHDRGNTGCIHVSVWYDRWTPGDTSGTLIRIATEETNTDDIYYNTLDTSNDTLALSETTPMDVSTDMTNTFAGGGNRMSI